MAGTRPPRRVQRDIASLRTAVSAAPLSVGRLTPRTQDCRGGWPSCIAEATPSPTALRLMTHRFELNGDMSRTDFIRDYTPHRINPRLPTSVPGNPCARVM
jgi:hypothetical protein